ncbi:hairy-related 8.2 [Callorhinchus milii]|uniref:hairy-related 8.2 n=1 Tax=Callorhinchus milii TaxID=7868 RepID=UPI001C3FDF34|nr:hairy-related 8.2 [Callorhinchus milii]
MTATTCPNNVEKLSNAKDERKLRKPLIERKRRERINNCLDQLKETIVGAFRLDQSKLEKADILEMTVKHLQNVQSNRLMADAKLGVEAQQRYSAGYIQCMHEVHNLLLTCDWMDKTVGARLLNHLLKSLPRSSEDSRRTGPPPTLQPSQTPVTQTAPGAGDALPHSSPDRIGSDRGCKVLGGDRGPFLSPAANPQPPDSSGDPSVMDHTGTASSDVWRPW